MESVLDDPKGDVSVSMEETNRRLSKVHDNLKELFSRKQVTRLSTIHYGQIRMSIYPHECILVKIGNFR